MSDEKKEPEISQAASTMLADLHGVTAPPEGEAEVPQEVSAPETPPESSTEAPTGDLPAKADESSSELLEGSEATQVADTPVADPQEAPGGPSEDAAEEVASPDAEGRDEGDELPVAEEEGAPVAESNEGEEAAVSEGVHQAADAGPSAAAVGEEGEGTAPAAVEGPLEASGEEEAPEPSFGEVRTEVADLDEHLPKEAIKALRAAGDATFNFLADMAEMDVGLVGQESQARLQSVRNKAVFFLSAIESVFTRS